MKKEFTKKDYIIMSIITGIYAVISFINLGSFDNPNTFINISSTDEVLIELDEETYLSKIKYFAGNRVDEYQLFLSKDNILYDKVIDLQASAFSWQEEKIFKSTKYLRIVPKDNLTLGEFAIYDNSSNKVAIKSITVNNKSIYELTDEEDTIPKQISYMNSTYFDEIYFARTAYEYANGLRAYEWTHPPLGKLIQAIPLKVFHKMAPFYYRLMGNIAGILMVLVMYVFAKKMFKKRLIAVLAASLISFDTFHFVQCRMGTVDSFLVLFILLSFYYMYNFIAEDKIKDLFLSGIFFALAVSTKWIGLYAGVALAIIFFTHIIKNKKISLKLLLKATVFFVIIPLTIYVATYFIYPNIEWLNEFSLTEVVRQNIRMFNYHSSLKDDHFFSSPYYTWPFSYKPVWYYSSDIQPNLHAGITGVGNIIIWWMGIVSYIYLLVKLFRKKDRISFFIVIAITFIYLPFIFISRVMFLYHYFSILPFVMLAVCYLFKDLTEKIKKNFPLYIYLFLVILFFVIYYPAISGMYMPKGYFESIKIFKTWYF